FGRRRQHDGKRRALRFPRALSADRSAMKLHDVPDDCEPDAKSAMRARRGTVALTKAIENVGKEIWTDSLAGIGHLEPQVRIDAIQAHLDFAPPGGDLHGIGQEVPRHLLKPVA